MDARTPIAYTIGAIVIAWLTLCGVIVITTDDTAGIQDVADASVAIVEQITDSVGGLIPVLVIERTAP